MANDWIKMRTNLRRHPKVIRMASALNADKLRVIGGLHAVWSVFDEHSEDGQLDGYTLSAMDDEISWPGFSQAMQTIGWLVFDPKTGMSVPEFDEHNGQSAKRRCQETSRKRKEREESEAKAKKLLELSASDADIKRSREEKRREEEKNTPLPPEGEGLLPPGFVNFWQTWPTTDRKQAKGKCLDAWKKASAERDAAVVLAHVRRMIDSDEWKRENGHFIPQPLTYLNQRRWEGAAIETVAQMAIV